MISSTSRRSDPNITRSPNTAHERDAMEAAREVVEQGAADRDDLVAGEVAQNLVQCLDPEPEGGARGERIGLRDDPGRSVSPPPPDSGVEAPP